MTGSKKLEEEPWTFLKGLFHIDLAMSWLLPPFSVIQVEKEADDQSYLLWWGDPSMLQSACRVLLATSCSLWAWMLSIEKLAWMGEWGMLHRVRLERCYTSLGPFVFYSRWLTSCWNAVGLSAAAAIFGISCTRGYLSLCLLLLSIQQT